MLGAKWDEKMKMQDLLPGSQEFYYPSVVPFCVSQDVA